MSSRKPTGGVGSNQYASKGTPTARQTRTEDAVLAERAAWAFATDTATVPSHRSARGRIRAAAHPKWQERADIAKLDTTEPELLVVLAADDNEWVRHAALNNPRCPSAVLDQAINLFGTDRTSEAVIAAGNPSCPSASLRRLWQAARPDVSPSGLAAKEVAANVATPPETLREIIQAADSRGGGTTLEAALTNPSCPPDLLRRYGDTTEPPTAGNPVTGPSYPQATYATLRNPSCPPDVLAYAIRNSPPVTPVAVRNPSAPVEDLEWALTTQWSSEAATNPSLTGEPLLRYLNDGHWWHTRTESVLADPDTPEWFLRAAEDHLEKRIAAALVKNPNAPKYGIAKIVTSELPAWVRAAATAHPNCPTTYLQHIVNDGGVKQFGKRQHAAAVKALRQRQSADG